MAAEAPTKKGGGGHQVEEQEARAGPVLLMGGEAGQGKPPTAGQPRPQQVPRTAVGPHHCPRREPRRCPGLPGALFSKLPEGL